MSAPLTITATRLATLVAIAKEPGIYVSHLADIVAPRPISPISYGTGNPIPWTAQGAARMGGKLVAALERAGLIKLRPSSGGVARATITHAGVAAIAKQAGQEGGAA